MQSSLDRQRESIRAQASAVVHAPVPAKAGEFFAVDWPRVPTVVYSAADCEPLSEPVVNNLIQQAAEEQGVDPGLVREVARQESDFRPCAVSAKGAAGLMQLMPDTAKRLEVRNPFDPRENLTAGSRFLKYLLERYDGDIASALGAYNAGPARVDKAGGVPAITETRRYVSGILSRLTPN
jgi:soluble lytic murein transglycosylase-like protein